MRGLTKTYLGHRAVDALDLAVATGSVHGLVGPNGAGKTTVLRAVLGLITPDAGTVALFGLDEGEVGPRARDGVGGFVDAPRFPPRLTARRALSLLAALDAPGTGVDGIGSVDAALDAVGLLGRAGQRVGGFSTGLRQRLGVAAALLRGARMLVLDEPTSGTDPASARHLHATLRALAQRGTTVLVSSHDLGAVEALCDDVTLVAGGRAVRSCPLAELVAEAPPAGHHVVTSDDERALEVSARVPAVLVERAAQDGGGQRGAGRQSGLVVRGSTAEVDAWVLRLASTGVAVRAMTPLEGPLEALMASLTAHGAPGEETR